MVDVASSKGYTLLTLKFNPTDDYFFVLGNSLQVEPGSNEPAIYFIVYPFLGNLHQGWNDLKGKAILLPIQTRHTQTTLQLT